MPASSKACWCKSFQRACCFAGSFLAWALGLRLAADFAAGVFFSITFLTDVLAVLADPGPDDVAEDALAGRKSSNDVGSKTCIEHCDKRCWEHLVGLRQRLFRSSNTQL